MKNYDHDLLKYDSSSFTLLRACGFDDVKHVMEALRDLKSRKYNDASLRLLALLLTAHLLSFPSIFLYLIVYPGLYDDLDSTNITKVIEIIENRLKYLIENDKQYVIDVVCDNLELFIQALLILMEE